MLCGDFLRTGVRFPATPPNEMKMGELAFPHFSFEFLFEYIKSDRDGFLGGLKRLLLVFSDFNAATKDDVPFVQSFDFLLVLGLFFVVA